MGLDSQTQQHSPRRRCSNARHPDLGLSTRVSAHLGEGRLSPTDPHGGLLLSKPPPLPGPAPPRGTILDARLLGSKAPLCSRSAWLPAKRAGQRNAALLGCNSSNWNAIGSARPTGTQKQANSYSFTPKGEGRAAPSTRFLGNREMIDTPLQAGAPSHLLHLLGHALELLLVVQQLVQLVKAQALQPPRVHRHGESPEPTSLFPAALGSTVAASREAVPAPPTALSAPPEVTRPLFSAPSLRSGSPPTEQVGGTG